MAKFIIIGVIVFCIAGIWIICQRRAEKQKKIMLESLQSWIEEMKKLSPEELRLEYKKYRNLVLEKDASTVETQKYRILFGMSHDGNNWSSGRGLSKKAIFHPRSWFQSRAYPNPDFE